MYSLQLLRQQPKRCFNHKMQFTPLSPPRLVILDRDGVLNEDRVNYVQRVEELRMLPGAGKAVARLNAARIPVALATNQSCVGKGLVSEGQLDLIHTCLETHLNASGGWLDAIFFCGDAQPSFHRKPGPGMLLDAMQMFNVQPQETVFIGDAMRDLQAAAAAGCAAILVRTGQGRVTEGELAPAGANVPVYDDLAQAVDGLLGPAQ